VKVETIQNNLKTIGKNMRKKFKKYAYAPWLLKGGPRQRKKKQTTDRVGPPGG